jgi:hypothetical protein
MLFRTVTRSPIHNFDFLFLQKYLFKTIIIYFSELLAPGRPIRALASDGCWAARFGWGEPISRRSGCKAQRMLRKTFSMLWRVFPHVANRRPCNIQRRMLRVCCACSEHVANEVTCNIQHRASFFHLPHMLRPCCDYVATMLRPVLRATSNIRSPPSPPSWHNTQH